MRFLHYCTTRHINGNFADFFHEFVKNICPFDGNMFSRTPRRKKGENYTADCKIYSKTHGTHLYVSTKFRAFTEYGYANRLDTSVNSNT